jgi:predicted dehydrogenase
MIMVNVAQIGVGYWGPNLLRNLSLNKDCRVKRVVDIAEERRNYVKSLYPSVEVSPDIGDIVNDPDIDAVVIATPFKSHFELATRMMQAGKHIFVEKPLVSRLSDIKKLKQLQTEKKVTVMVGHTFLFNSAVKYVKNLIDAGDLGDIRYIYSQRLNLGRIRSDINALWNFAPHDISIIQYWLNEAEPVSVTANGLDYIQDDIYDVVFLNLIYPDKIMANIHVSWLDPQRVRKMIVVGSKKMVIYDDIAGNKIAIYDKGIDRMAVLGKNMDYDVPDSMRFSHRSGDVLLPKINFEEPLKVEMAHFIDCVANGTKCLTDIEHAEKVTKILYACNPLS